MARDDPAPLARLGQQVVGTSIRRDSILEGDTSSDPQHGHVDTWRPTPAGVVRLADALHMRWVMRRAARALPQSLRVRLVQTQVRTGYMQGLILVPEAELETSLRAALALLAPELARPGTA